MCVICHHLQLFMISDFGGMSTRRCVFGRIFCCHAHALLPNNNSLQESRGPMLMSGCLFCLADMFPDVPLLRRQLAHVVSAMAAVVTAAALCGHHRAAPGRDLGIAVWYHSL